MKNTCTGNGGLLECQNGIRTNGLWSNSKLGPRGEGVQSTILPLRVS